MIIPYGFRNFFLVIPSVHNMVRPLSFTILLRWASYFKVNVIFGSTMAYFSAINIAGPLIGLYGGKTDMLFAFIMQGIIAFSMHKTISVTSLIILYHIPTIFASAYWRSSHWSIRLAIPLLCMLLFNMHPIGGQAFLYSCYWLIPVILYCIPKQSIFMTALGSTFIAHAVGSVVWLYAVPMTSSEWLVLMPVVALERLVFAGGMTLSYYAINGFSTLSKNLYEN